MKTDARLLAGLSELGIPYTEQMLEYASRGLLAGLGDPYTFYYSPDEFEELFKDDEGKYVGENNRKVPGKGKFPWNDIGGALRSIGYDKNVVMEPFVIMGGEVGSDIKIWRDISKGASQEQLDADARDSVAFLRRSFEG